MKEFQNITYNNLGYRKQANQTYVEFAREKQPFFDRWCHFEQISGSYDYKQNSHMKQLLLLEECENCVSNDFKIYLNVDALCMMCR